jgi:hypothetical protein
MTDADSESELGDTLTSTMASVEYDDAHMCAHRGSMDSDITESDVSVHAPT